MSSGIFGADSALKSDGAHVVSRPSLQAEHNLFNARFDEAFQTLRSSTDQQTVDRVLDQLFEMLRERKRTASLADWSAFVLLCRRHPLMTILHQDPFTYRAFSKPRGYAGDAEMMDFIYGREDQWPPPPADILGQRIFNFTTLTPASEGVRARRAFISTAIDRLTEEKRHPNILAIAAGHLREAELSAAVRRRKFGRFVALDADPISSIEVQRRYAHYGVEAVTASFRRLLTDRKWRGEFDLVYSTGLFDYLVQRTARRLVSVMFQMLRPRGVLLVANFLPDIRDIGYMETFMDWNLIYRTRRDMVDLTMDIPEEEVKEVMIVSEEHKNIVFLQLTRNPIW